MKISLMVLSAGKAAGKALPITSAQFIIGRDPECNLRPASAMISKRHCAVIVRNGQVFLRDFDSTNGTFVNEQQLKGETALKDGDILKVGPLSFKVLIEGQPAAKPVAPAPKATPEPVLADISDDDAAAAAYLSLGGEEDNHSSSELSETSEDSVPGGTTVMDVPAIPAEMPKEAAPAVPRAEERKPAPGPKKPASTGAAQDAARAILDKLRTGRRVTPPKP